MARNVVVDYGSSSIRNWGFYETVKGDHGLQRMSSVAADRDTKPLLQNGTFLQHYGHHNAPHHPQHLHHSRNCVGGGASGGMPTKPPSVHMGFVRNDTWMHPSQHQHQHQHPREQKVLQALPVRPARHAMHLHPTGYGMRPDAHDARTLQMMQPQELPSPKEKHMPPLLVEEHSVVVRNKAETSELTAARQEAREVSYRVDVLERKVGNIQKRVMGMQDKLNRMEPLLQGLVYSQGRRASNLGPSVESKDLPDLVPPAELENEKARSAEDSWQISQNGTQGTQSMSTPEGNFNFPSPGLSVVVTGWGEDPLPPAVVASPTLNNLNLSHGPELARQCPQYPRKLPKMAKDMEKGVSEEVVPEQGERFNHPITISYPFTHNLPKDIMPANLDWSIDDKHAFVEVRIPEIPEQEKRELPPQSGLHRLSCLILVAAHMRNNTEPRSEPFDLNEKYANLKALLIALLNMVGRDDRWLWSTGLLWKPPPWPDFCAMGCDSVAQHGGYEVLVNFHSVKKYHISLDKAFEFNDYCRSHHPPISLIKAEVCGLFGSVFCDFGPEFSVLDVDGEVPHTGIIASISNDNPALVSCVDEERLEFQNGDLVVFSEVQGMTELNDSKEGPANVCVIELGGTIGDIESMNFVDALGQFSYRVGAANFCLVHVSLVQVWNVVGEQKTKPTQRSVHGLRGLVLTPNILAGCSIKELEENVKEKLSQFCHVPAANIFTLYDVSNIRRIPLLLWDQKAHVAIHKDLSLESIAWEPNLEEWVARATLYDTLQDTIRIDMVGKYTSLSDSYLSVLKALLHALVACHRKLVIDWVVRIWDPGTGSKNMKGQSSPLGVVGGITFGAVSAIDNGRVEKVPNDTGKIELSDWAIDVTTPVGFPIHATDLVLNLTQMLRKHGVVGKFVEFYGEGMGKLSLADRATIANLLPEYGATMDFFPVDHVTLDYLKLTGRSGETVSMMEAYLRANKMFVDCNEPQTERVYHSYLELDFTEMGLCISGPKRPHNRVPLKEMESDWYACPETEHVFPDAFWEGSDIVINALDNVNAMMYMDMDACTSRNRFWKSGTLGAKCNTQMVIPHLTENYEVSRDPSEKQTPRCTVHSFPYNIDYCLIWAKSEFEGLLEKTSTEVSASLSNPTGYAAASRIAGDAQARDQLERVVECLHGEKLETFQDCITGTRLKFEDYFSNRVKQLTCAFPEESTISSGVPFWSAPKRSPWPLEFTFTDPSQLNLGLAASILRAETFGAVETDWAQNLKKRVKAVDKVISLGCLNKILEDKYYLEGEGMSEPGDHSVEGCCYLCWS